MTLWQGEAVGETSVRTATLQSKSPPTGPSGRLHRQCDLPGVGVNGQHAHFDRVVDLDDGGGARHALILRTRMAVSSPCTGFRAAAPASPTAARCAPGPPSQRQSSQRPQTEPPRSAQDEVDDRIGSICRYASHTHHGALELVSGLDGREVDSDGSLLPAAAAALRGWWCIGLVPLCGSVHANGLTARRALEGGMSLPRD